jgi:hypothetical protein
MLFSNFGTFLRSAQSSRGSHFLLGLTCLLAAKASLCQAGPGFSGSLDAPEAVVIKAVQLIVSDPTIYGTYSYEKEKQLRGAKPSNLVTVFGDAPDAGRQFFKVAENVLAPRHFKETADMGTIYVRYLVRGTGSATTALQIDALYVEKNRRRQHPSDGTVEQSEFAAIRDRLEKIQAQEGELTHSTSDNPSSAAIGLGSAPEAVSKPISSPQELEKKLLELKHRVEMQTVAGGAALKAAPYRTAATLQSMPAQAELLVMIVTKYWYGVETTDGHRGWIHRSQLEPLP